MSRLRLFGDNQAVDAIRRCVEKNGLYPTVREFADELGVGSTRTALRYLKRLETIGLIVRWPGARGLALRTADMGPSVALKDPPERGDTALGEIEWLKAVIAAVKTPLYMNAETRDHYWDADCPICDETSEIERDEVLGVDFVTLEQLSEHTAECVYTRREASDQTTE